LRAAMKRRQRNRRILLLSIAAVAIVVVIVSAFVLGSIINPTSSSLINKPVTSQIYSSLESLSKSTYSYTDPTLMSGGATNQANAGVQNNAKNSGGVTYTENGKPIIVYIGGEYCPYCGFQRWPLILSLMRFGNLTGLEFMQSSATDVFPNTYTFTFLTAKYTSPYFYFQSFEQVDRNEEPLQTVPSNYTGVFADYGSGYPYINFANKYVISGPFYVPSLFTGLNWTQIIQQIGSNTELSDQVQAATNTITAVICSVDGSQPASVCGNSAITPLISTVSYHSEPSASLKTGSPIEMASTWASVQYGQMAWIKKSSAIMR